MRPILHIINFLESIHSCVMCTNFEIASVIFKIYNFREPAPTPGPLLLPARSYSRPAPTPGPLLLPARSYSRPAPTPGPLLLLTRSYSWPAPTPGPLLLLARSYSWPVTPVYRRSRWRRSKRHLKPVFSQSLNSYNYQCISCLIVMSHYAPLSITLSQCPRDFSWRPRHLRKVTTVTVYVTSL